MHNTILVDDKHVQRYEYGFRSYESIVWGRQKMVTKKPPADLWIVMNELNL